MAPLRSSRNKPPALPGVTYFFRNCPTGSADEVRRRPERSREANLAAVVLEPPRSRHPYPCSRHIAIGQLDNGAEVCEVAATLEVTAQTVYNWSHGWRERGLCGLLIGHKGARSRALPEAMLATAVSAARMESPTLAQIAQRSGSWRATAVPCGDLGLDAQARRLLLQPQSLYSPQKTA